ncbi:B- and T-lymphocyte attenuator [Discoglossus pictus]
MGNGIQSKWMKCTLLLLISALALSNSQDDGYTAPCTVHISIEINTQYHRSTGEPLTLRCPVHFCPPQLHNITWCKFHGERCEIIKEEPGISFEWTEQMESNAVYLLKIKSVGINTTGNYLCSVYGGQELGHKIQVTIHATHINIKEMPKATKVRFATAPRTISNNPGRPQPGASSRTPDPDPPTESVEII